jgi:hypothetical protein
VRSFADTFKNSALRAKLPAGRELLLAGGAQVSRSGHRVEDKGVDKGEWSR